MPNNANSQKLAETTLHHDHHHQQQQQPHHQSPEHTLQKTPTIANDLPEPTDKPSSTPTQ